MDNRGSPRPEQNPLVHRRPHKLVCPPKPPPLLEKRQRQRQKQRLRNTIQSIGGFQQNPSPIPPIPRRGNLPDTREGSQPKRPCLRSSHLLPRTQRGIRKRKTSPPNVAG